MSLLEGYSNHVMNAAGERLLPGFAQIHERFERRNENRGPLERAIMRLTGLDLKMEQYQAGERFVDTVIAVARPRLHEPRLAGPRDAARPRRDPRAGALDRPHGGIRSGGARS